MYQVFVLLVVVRHHMYFNQKSYLCRMHD